MPREIRKVGVAGADAAGAGIVQLCVQNGLEALLFDETEEILGRAEDAVLRGLHRAEQPAAFSLLRKTTDLRALAGCDFVIESAQQRLEAKKDLLRRIDAQLPPDRVLATNTAVLPVGILAESLENPKRTVGMRFYPPVSITPLVEIIRCAHSSEDAVETALSLAASLGKTAVPCKDAPGFIVGRVSRPFFLVSMRLLEQGRGSPADIDRALRGGAGVRAGPFELMDMMGLEEELAASAAIYDLMGRPERLKPCAVQEKLIARGCRGRRNNRGFYVYAENPPGTVNPLLAELVAGLGQRTLAPAEICRVVMEGVVAEAREAAKDGVASVAEIDEALRLGMGWGQGPFAWEKRHV